ncbi:MAG TPA: ABC transporter permease [Myxococcota bacterium]|nr:ABC transporter permease [Myxococcota bacterium]HRY94236.1 ABC transporter permease [Myxococcota bacterium]HSA23105.1 ABC transporter permease [Myxococcota bacterium]
MRFRSLARLVRQNVRRNFKNLAFSAVGIVVGIASFFFFLSLGAGVKDVVATEIFPMDANRIMVVPRTAQFGALAGGRQLDDGALAELERLPGVQAVYPRLPLRFLATTAVDGREISPATLALLEKVPGLSPGAVRAVRDVRLWLEIMGNGIDPRLVQPDLVAGEFRDPGEGGGPIPVLLSERMVEIYNASFAEARGLPKVDRRLLPFLPALPLTLNHSFISRQTAGPSLRTQMKVVGLSRHALMGGVTVPLETARRTNRLFVGEEAAHQYDAAIVEVVSSDLLSPVQEAVGALGFDLDVSEKRMAESVGLAVMLVTLGFSLISLIIVGIAAVNIAHTFFMVISERKRELGLLRALGASRADLRGIILGEASVIGVVGGGLGLLFGLGACGLVDVLINRVLPDFPFKPDSLFRYPWWLFVGSLLFAVLFCWLGALWPANRAARLDPASALTAR